MLALFTKSAICTLLVSFSLAPLPVLQSRIEERQTRADPAAKSPKGPKRTVWNLDGGAFFSTDGHLANGSCFRLSGQMTAPDFFDGLRRVDTPEGSIYTFRDQIVTDYPPQLFVILHVRDFPCTFDLKDTTVRPPLSRELMSTLHLNFFWKEGIAMRPVESIKRTNASAKRLAPYSTEAADELAPRFEWNYSFLIESAGVPLTNGLVLVIEDEEHKIAARVAAHL